jgi:hypothetical protein
MSRPSIPLLKPSIIYDLEGGSACGTCRCPDTNITTCLTNLTKFSENFHVGLDFHYTTINDKAYKYIFQYDGIKEDTQSNKDLKKKIRLHVSEINTNPHLVKLFNEHRIKNYPDFTLKFEFNSVIATAQAQAQAQSKKSVTTTASTPMPQSQKQKSVSTTASSTPLTSTSTHQSNSKSCFYNRDNLCDLTKENENIKNFIKYIIEENDLENDIVIDNDIDNEENKLYKKKIKNIIELLDKFYKWNYGNNNINVDKLKSLDDKDIDDYIEYLNMTNKIINNLSLIFSKENLFNIISRINFNDIKN